MDITNPIKLCACGCNKILNKSKKYIHGHNKPWLGKKRVFTEKHRKNLSIGGMGIVHFSASGKENPMWKGNQAGYTAIHIWINKNFGSPKECEHCKTTKAKKYEWANVDHKYRRIKEDYIRLCTSCHRKYDIINNNYKQYATN